MERFIQVSVMSESKAWIQEGELQADEMPRLIDILVAGSLLQFCINLERKKEEVICSGNLEGTLSIACDRCGQPLKLDVDEEFTFKMVPEANLDSQNGKEVFLEDEDLDMDFYRDDQIDWKSILEDQVILALPIRNLCEEQGQLACEIPLNPQEIENLKTDNPFSSLSNSGWENN
ncbi:MAG: YceD family protein [SAR324 cluster bacterium]|nr:YceD family protein [SAR324 cluster bacterium]